VPQAWSPDGRWLAVIAYDAPRWEQSDGLIVPHVVRATLHLVGTASGAHRLVAGLDPLGVHDGFTVAFTSDGTRVAYQSGQAVTVATLDGRVVNRFTVGADRHLAGKGAWTRDGRALILSLIVIPPQVATPAAPAALRPALPHCYSGEIGRERGEGRTPGSFDKFRPFRV
jgi:hypothetical protein